MDFQKYVGQIISSDGKNIKIIEKIELTNKIIQMLEAMPGGFFFFL